MKKSVFSGAAVLALVTLLSTVGCSSEIEEETAKSEDGLGGCPNGQVPSFWWTVEAPSVTAGDVVFNVGSWGSCIVFARAPGVGTWIVKVLGGASCASAVYYTESQLRALGIHIAQSRAPRCIPDPVPQCARDCRSQGFGGGMGNWAGHCACSWDVDGNYPVRAICADNTPLGQCSPQRRLRCEKPGGSDNAGSPYYQWGASCTPSPVNSPGGAPCTQYDVTYSMSRCGGEGPNRDKLYNCNTGTVVYDCAASFGVGCRRIGSLTSQMYHDGCPADEPRHSAGRTRCDNNVAVGGCAQGAGGVWFKCTNPNGASGGTSGRTNASHMWQSCSGACPSTC